MNFPLKLRQLGFSPKPSSKRYAVLVGQEEADYFDIPGANIVESWEHSDGLVMMIVESPNDITQSAAEFRGVRAIEKM